MASKPYLSVVIPAYNEAERLSRHLSSVLEYLNQHYPKYELILVDDGSTDATAAKIDEAIKNESPARLISYAHNRGKGYAVKTGVLATHGEIVLFMDADLSTPLTEIPKILKLLQAADIVIGSRGQSDAPFYRHIASIIFDQVKFFLVGLRQFRDTQCGFKAFKGDVARQLFAKSQVERFMFDVEILYLAQKLGYRITEIPVTWADVPGSHVRFWEGLVNMFRDLWRIRYINKYA